jgi:fibronectin type 3 domain-containing protein
MMYRRVLSAAVLAVCACMIAGCSTNPVSSLGATDATAPSTPSSISAQARGSELVLTWDESADADVAGYNVYRYAPDPSRENAYVLVNSALVTGTEYVVSDAAGDPAWYRVKAVDTSANASAASTAVQAAMPRDGSASETDPIDPGVEKQTGR